MCCGGGGGGKTGGGGGGGGAGHGAAARPSAQPRGGGGGCGWFSPPPMAARSRSTPSSGPTCVSRSRTCRDRPSESGYPATPPARPPQRTSALAQRGPGHPGRPATEEDRGACDALTLRVHGHDRGAEVLEAIGQGNANVVEHD